jgi:predicted esterase
MFLRRTASRNRCESFLVLHGMGGNGTDFSASLLRDADRNNWVVVAPTFQYHNYLDPTQLTDDDLLFSKQILATLDVLPSRLNLTLHQHILIYGFSRGAQLAHRFAFFYPDRVESVVTLSAGAYTMPSETRSNLKDAQILPFPYGIGDLKECTGQAVNWQALKQVSFWIGVGAEDNNANDVARAFDPYGGKTRVERAKAFEQALQSLGIDARLTIFPDSTHEVTSQMRTGAVQFLHDDEAVDHWDD